MSTWFKRIFRHDRRAIIAHTRQQTLSVEYLDENREFAHISALNFFGLIGKSPNGRYLLGWSDRDIEGSRGGYRESGLGRYILLDGGNLIIDGRAERPNDGKVADNGTFIFNDWRFGDGLKGSFFAYRSTGELILRRDFTANLYNNGLAPDGRYAVCQTCHADGPDNTILAVFDLGEGAVIASWQPESGWADQYAFPSEREGIDLCYRNGRIARFSLSGEFLNRVEWRANEIATGNVWAIRRALKQVEAGEVSLPRELLFAGLAAAVAPDRDNRSRAGALRLRGELLEAECNLIDALADFESALELDPAVGLKRKAAQLRKRLSKGS